VGGKFLFDGLARQISQPSSGEIGPSRSVASAASVKRDGAGPSAPQVPQPPQSNGPRARQEARREPGWSRLSACGALRSLSHPVPLISGSFELAECGGGGLVAQRQRAAFWWGVRPFFESQISLTPISCRSGDLWDQQSLREQTKHGFRTTVFTHEIRLHSPQPAPTLSYR
jgi:hypothetical protein